MWDSSSPPIRSFGDLSWHAPVKIAQDSSESLPAATLSPATIQPGQTLTANANGDLNGSLAFGGYAGFVVGDRVLVTEATNEGIWVVVSVGGATSKWQLVRATDADTAAELPVGTVTFAVIGVFDTAAVLGPIFQPNVLYLRGSGGSWSAGTGATSDLYVDGDVTAALDLISEYGGLNIPSGGITMGAFGIAGGLGPTTHVYGSHGASTWIAPTGLHHIRVRCRGAGAGGGGAPAVGTVGQHSEGGGGGQGGYSESIIDAATAGASQTVTVGQGGAGGAGAAAGSAGGDSSFGALVVAKGGNGGAQGTATSIFLAEAGGSGGAASGGTGDLRVTGAPGGNGVGSAGRCASGQGGGEGGGLAARIGGDNSALAGNPGTTGGGGSGAAESGASTARTGGAGGDGWVIIEEFYGP